MSQGSCSFYRSSDGTQSVDDDGDTVMDAGVGMSAPRRRLVEDP